jgi:hypothetical protein
VCVCMRTRVCAYAIIVSKPGTQILMQQHFCSTLAVAITATTKALLDHTTLPPQRVI